jgi:Uma2 family endonuclease
VINEQVRLPTNLTTLDAFRQWASSVDCPERGRFAFLAGVFWVDLTMEQLYTHNDPKMEIGGVLRILARASGQGRYFGDGVSLTNAGADLSTVPDGVFVLHSTFQSGHVREIPGQHPGFIELQGTPDMVLEVVSDTSVQKDTVTLPGLYHRAGIAEFWRVDARSALTFEILRRTPSGYLPTQLPDGWWRSDVFGRDFLLTQSQDARGRPEFTLQERP